MTVHDVLIRPREHDLGHQQKNVRQTLQMSFLFFQLPAKILNRSLQFSTSIYHNLNRPFVGCVPAGPKGSDFLPLRRENATSNRLSGNQVAKFRL